MERIKNQPFAHDIQDETLDRKLKDEIWEGDPMANSYKQKRSARNPNSKPVYKGLAPKPNQFNIPPDIDGMASIEETYSKTKF